MKFWMAVEIALTALRANRVRSALTMLGIVIGVAAVIAMVAVGSGATERIQQQIEAIGSNLILVTRGASLPTGSAWAAAPRLRFPKMMPARLPPNARQWRPWRPRCGAVLR